MPKSGLTEIIAVIDKSGSMGAVQNDAIGGFNAFIKGQKKGPGKAVFTVVLFDTNYSFVCQGLPVERVRPLDGKTYFPSGCTALYDAVGRAIDETGKRLSDLREEERPEKVIMVILTDGEENSSKEYGRQQVMEKIARQRDVYKWEFVFLGAGPEAMKGAAGMGIARNRQMDFKTRENIAGAYACLNDAVSSYRSGMEPEPKEK